MRVLPAICSLLIATSAAAQVTETMTVEVIEVPVYVSSRARVPIRGLTRDDFTLYVNGKVHPVEYFDVIDRRAEPAEPSLMPVLKRRRMTMLLFDIAGSGTWMIRRAQKHATAFIAESQGSDSFAVAVLTGAGVKMLVPFTTDRDRVTRAIGSLRSTRADALGIAPMEDQPRTVIAESFERVDLLSHVPAAEGAPREEMEYAPTGMPDTVAEQLRELAEALAPLEGQKSVVLLSAGMFDLSVNSALLRMHKAFRTAGVVLDAVNVVGLTGPFEPGSSGLLHTLALDTGGYVIQETNNLARALRELNDMESVVYVLGFKAPPTATSTNSIRIDVRGIPRLASVRYRKQYSTSAPDELSAAALADVLLNDIAQNGITVDAEVAPGRGAAAISGVLPGKEVLAYVGDQTMSADVFFYVFDATNTVRGWGRKHITIDGTKARNYLDTRPLRVTEAIKLPPGPYVAKVLFKLNGTLATGFVKQAFVIPSL